MHDKNKIIDELIDSKKQKTYSEDKPGY